MISAWGVDHGEVSKSFSPRVGWKPISAMTAKQKAAIPGAQAKMHKVRPIDRRYAREEAGLVKQIKTDPETRQTLKAGIQKNPWAFSSHAVTIRTGGAKRGKSYVIGDSLPQHYKQLAAHENEHAKVKRSGYRLGVQIRPNPEKIMREEARADFRAVGHYTKKQPHPSGYVEVARWRDKALKGPNRPAKGSGPQRDIMHEYGKTDFKRVTNQTAYEARAFNHFTSMGYNLNGKRRDRGVDAYRNLHNKLRERS